ncbi:mitochondrial import inner membrane translocase subunit tim16-B-like [Tigriopus californicus]|nr:mitochondrial import inner membrane translocase subunit tim16-B-like [Tigriopus californicus]
MNEVCNNFRIFALEAILLLLLLSSGFDNSLLIMAKHLAQLIIAGAQVVGKAFVSAVRQEIRMSQEAAKRHANKNSTASAAETTRSGISLDEAMEILNVDHLKDVESIQKNYEHLFNVNDKAKGGSFYLQSKVVRAKERVDQEMQLQGQVQGEESQKKDTG